MEAVDSLKHYFFFKNFFKSHEHFECAEIEFEENLTENDQKKKEEVCTG